MEKLMSSSLLGSEEGKAIAKENLIIVGKKLSDSILKLRDKNEKFKQLYQNIDNQIHEYQEGIGVDKDYTDDTINQLIGQLERTGESIQKFNDTELKCQNILTEVQRAVNFIF